MYIQSPSEQIKTTRITHSGATVSKQPVGIGGRVYIPLNDAAENAPNAYAYECELADAPTPASQTWAVGDEIYCVPGASFVFTTDEAAVGALFCGHALEAKASASLLGKVAFNSFAHAIFEE